MPVRKATAEWKGNLAEGAGRVATESGALKSEYRAATRFGSERGPNPDELLGAAHAACFSMALSHALDQAGHTPESVKTEARVELSKVEKGFAITRIDLHCEARVPGIDDETFQEHAAAAKTGCPISGALAAVDIHLVAHLT